MLNCHVLILMTSTSEINVYLVCINFFFMDNGAPCSKMDNGTNIAQFPVTEMIGIQLFQPWVLSIG